MITINMIRRLLTSIYDYAFDTPAGADNLKPSHMCSNSELAFHIYDRYGLRLISGAIIAFMFIEGDYCRRPVVWAYEYTCSMDTRTLTSIIRRDPWPRGMLRPFMLDFGAHRHSTWHLLERMYAYYLPLYFDQVYDAVIMIANYFVFCYLITDSYETTIRPSDYGKAKNLLPAEQCSTLRIAFHACIYLACVLEWWDC